MLRCRERFAKRTIVRFILARRAAPGTAALTALVFITPLVTRQPPPQKIDTLVNLAPASNARRWMDTNLSPDAQLPLAAMPFEQRLSFRGNNARLGLSSKGGGRNTSGLSGGENGVQQPPVRLGRSSVTAFPNVIVLGPAWDRDLPRRFGEAVGEGVHGKGGWFLGGPTVNLLRTWHWGCAAETFGENLFHMSELVVPEILGIQSRQVGAVVKPARTSRESPPNRAKRNDCGELDHGPSLSGSPPSAGRFTKSSRTVHALCIERGWHFPQGRVSLRGRKSLCFSPPSRKNGAPAPFQRRSL